MIFNFIPGSSRLNPHPELQHFVGRNRIPILISLNSTLRTGLTRLYVSDTAWLSNLGGF